MKYKREIRNKSTQDKFILEVSYIPIKDETLEFKFSNNLYLLEKKLLKIIDGENILHPDAIISITPKKMYKKSVSISNNKPFVYVIKGSFLKENQFIRLKLPSVEYILEIGKEYNIEIGKDNDISNREILKT
jgi:hypothetical protein